MHDRVGGERASRLVPCQASSGAGTDAGADFTPCRLAGARENTGLYESSLATRGKKRTHTLPRFCTDLSTFFSTPISLDSYEVSVLSKFRR